MNKTRPPIPHIIPHGPPPPSPADEGLSASYFLPAQPSAATQQPSKNQNGGLFKAF